MVGKFGLGAAIYQVLCTIGSLMNRAVEWTTKMPDSPKSASRVGPYLDLAKLSTNSKRSKPHD